MNVEELKTQENAEGIKTGSGFPWLGLLVFLAAAGAGPVYKLLGKKDLGTTEFPAIETPLIDGDIAFRQHSSGHTPAPNWPVFLTFARRYLKGPAAVAGARLLER